MRRRRRRFFREDVIAPWAAMGVIIGFWWLSVLAIGRDRSGEPDIVRLPAPAPVTERRSPVADPSAVPSLEARPADTPPEAPAIVVPERTDGADVTDVVRELRGKNLLVPVDGMKASSLHSTFGDPRGPTRAHEALDILAPRGTPVVAASDGRIVKLFTSDRGGLTVYQFDPEERFCFYYAHLDSYVPGLLEGAVVTRGQTIGFVGTTGNAPPGTPHLHFAINQLGEEKRWWEGEPIDPYLALQAADDRRD